MIRRRGDKEETVAPKGKGIFTRDPRWETMCSIGNGEEAPRGGTPTGRRRGKMLWK